MALTSNLYPPLLPNVIPGFDRSKALRIYFAISEYNSIEDIEHVQVLLAEVKTNKSALNSTKFPSGIKLINKYNIWEDQSIENDFKYYIIIDPTDLQDGQFKRNTYYKLQLRFTSTDAQFVDATTLPQSITSWINNNLMYFSEWSKATVLRGIDIPTLNLKTFFDQNTQTQHTDEGDNRILKFPPTVFEGELNFPKVGDKVEQQDYLKQYNIQIYLSHMIDDDALVLDSGPQYPNSKNYFSYNVPYTFEHLNYYYFVYVTYITKTLYQKTERYTIKIQPESSTDDGRLVTVKRVVDHQTSPNSPKKSFQNQSLYGYIHLNFQMNVDDDTDSSKDTYKIPNADYLIRRSSSKDNFNMWEDLYTLHYPFKNIYWRDITVENGVFYKYGLFRPPHRLNPIITPPEVCMFEDNFLVGNNIVFKLAFNPTLSGFRYNTSESQQITLGGKYPFIKRNAENYYRTFSISGLVSSLSNEYWWQDAQANGGSLKEKNYYWQHSDPGTRAAGAPHYIQFTSKEDIYDNTAKIRNDYVKTDVLTDWKNRYNMNGIDNSTMFDLYRQLQNREGYSDYLNPLYERMFREKFYNFLYDGKAKLFKSPTEGNILIRLTDISFEPVNELGRMLYSFSATATEIDEPTFKNCLKYGVVTDKFIDLVSYGALNAWSPISEIARMTEHAVRNEEITQSSSDPEYNKADKVNFVLEERYVKDGKVYGSS